MMNTYIFWTAKGEEAESQQMVFKWHGSYQEGELRLALLDRRVTSWYLSNGQLPKNCQDLNLVTLTRR